jgi:magnesium transporter
VIRALVYGADGVAAHDDVAAAIGTAGTTWIRVADPTDAELAAVEEACGLHALEIEDVRSNVRPKIEQFEEHTMVLLKEARLRRGETTFEEEIEDIPVGLFFGNDWLVTLTLTSEEPDAVTDAWAAVEREEGRVLRRGPDFAAYRVIDGVVDGYFAILDGIEDRLERIEEEILAEPDRDTLVEINSARRELLSVRKLLWPSREAVSVLARGDPPQVRESTEKYYRDVYDHLVQLVDLTETYRDLAAGARDIYLNSLSVSTNEVMKTLTVVATIVLPLTFIVGVYGMNFGDGRLNMPELGWQLGYPAVLVGMAGVAAVMVWHFRREGWL